MPASLGSRGVDVLSRGFRAGAASALLLLSTPVLAQQDEIVSPKLLEHQEAPYPASKVGEHVEADVILFITVNKDGSVEDPQVAESGGAEFDQAAIETVR